MQKFSSWLSPIIALFFVTALSVTASSTIGTSISTGGDLTVTGNSTLTGTLGVTGVTTLATFTASTTGAGSDITLQAMDDITLNAGVTSNGGITMYSGVNDDFYFSLGGVGYIQMDSAGIYNEVTGAGVSSYYRTSAGDGGEATLNLDASTGGGFNQANLRAKNTAGTVVSELFIGDSDTYIDVGGGTNEATFGAGLTTFTGSVKLPTASAPPVACDAGAVAQVYFDTDINEPCYCNASAWTAMDGAGACS